KMSSTCTRSTIAAPLRPPGGGLSLFSVTPPGVFLATGGHRGGIWRKMSGEEASHMRHVAGIGLAIVLAGAVFFAASWGYLRLLRIALSSANISELPSPGANLLHDTTVLYAVAALAGTALLAGVFAAAPRISPLAPGLPGLALVGWSVWYGLSMNPAVRYIPLRADSFGAGFTALLENGLL